VEKGFCLKGITIVTLLFSVVNYNYQLYLVGSGPLVDLH
jgi:hypothetical protein